jgi:hypothetical protein
MRGVILSIVAAGLMMAMSVPAAAQTNPFASGTERFYKSGSAVVKVAGSFQVDEEIPLTVMPSYTASDGQTWIVYGDETSGAPFVIFTYGPYGYGLAIGRDGRTAVAEFDMCRGDVVVTPATVTGAYTCPEVEFVDRSFTLLKISIDIRFTASS